MEKENKKDIKFGDFYTPEIYTWCTNCGNYGIHASLKRALAEEDILPKDTVVCFDIGCNGNGADKLVGAYRFKGLHGRVIPLAVGVHLANRKLKVIATGGDGGLLNEGIQHLIHAVRSNYDVMLILHNNANFGLTTGQASCATKQEVPMSFAPDGIPEATLNPTSLMLSMQPSFVARGFSGNVPHLTKVFREALNHKGFSYVEVLQTCTAYNKATPHEWYQERVYDVSEDEKYDRADLENARKISMDMNEKVAIGVLYQDKKMPTFYDRLANRKDIKTEIVDEVESFDVSKMVERFR